MRFRYRAATGDGSPVEGIADAASTVSLIEQLRRRDLYPLAIDEVESSPPRRRGRRVGRHRAVAVWTRSFATLLAAAVPVDRALAVTLEQTEHERMADALRRVRRAVREGAGLAEAMSRYPAFFSPLVTAMVAAGEAGGALEAVFGQLADYLEEAAELRAQTRSALLYPALMAVVASLGVAVLLVFVVPRFSAILEGVGGTLPLSTRVLVWSSTMLSRSWVVWLGMGVAAAYGVHAVLARPGLRRRVHERRLSWPVVGELELKYLTARLTRTMGMLLTSGVGVVPALRIARASVTNLAVRDRLDAAAAAVAEGTALAPSLVGSLPPLAVQMLVVGEESGRVEEMCVRIADTYDGEVRRALRSAVAMIEPILILVFGALVGFVALAMLQAIYSINTSMF